MWIGLFLVIYVLQSGVRMAAMNDDTKLRRVKRGRRSPWRASPLVLTGLLLTGGAYALFDRADPRETPMGTVERAVDRGRQGAVRRELLDLSRAER